MLSLAQLLANAHALGAAGRLAEAEQLCREILRANPRSAEALFQLGVILAPQNARLNEAIAALSEAQRIAPDTPQIAAALQRTKAIGENRRGMALAEAGDLRAAESCYRAALEFQPDFVPALGNLGKNLARQSRPEEAAIVFECFVELQPKHAGALQLLAALRHQLGEFGSAVGYYRRALELTVDSAAIHLALGNALTELGQSEEAIGAWRKAAELKPDLVEAHFNAGHELLERGRNQEAESYFHRVTVLAPDLARGHDLLGLTLLRQKQTAAAAVCQRKAAELDPSAAGAWLNLGTTLIREKKIDEAIDCFRRALTIEPEFPGAHYNLGCALLLQGELAEGFREYAWLWKCPGNHEPSYSQPHWLGEPLDGKTILLHVDHGHGDILQMVRYTTLLKERGARVILDCQTALTGLLARSPGVDVAVHRIDPTVHFDLHQSLMQLPHVFGTTLATIPGQVPYLFPDPAAVERWREELASQKSLKVGVAWQGDPKSPYDIWRSFPLSLFEEIARIPHVQLYCLQSGTGREQLAALAHRVPMIDLAGRLGDFHNTAALVTNLDLVISCDSSPVHVAGALGVPVWVALPFVPDWRWMLDRDDSPWYPSARLFRQSDQDRWDDVFERIEVALREML